MADRSRGFTLLELIIVVAIIATIATIAIPNLLASRLSANEAAAASTLRALANAQAQCQISRAIDVNDNGEGEYGFAAELGALTGIRTSAGTPGATMMQPRLITIADGTSVTFVGGTITTGGAIMRSGYYFALFLPSSSGDFVPEDPQGGGSAAHNPDPTNAAVMWCAYAWPSARGSTGVRCYFINQDGDLLAARNTAATARYNGAGRGPAPSAAFLSSVGSVTMASTTAANATGQDGQRWLVVQ